MPTVRQTKNPTSSNEKWGFGMQSMATSVKGYLLALLALKIFSNTD